MVTVGDQINGALRLLGLLAEGETPSAETSQDCLSAFNQMLDSWSTESLFIYNTQDQQFTWGAGYATRTLGPTGDFVGNRPTEILPSTYFRDASTGISYAIRIINQEQYNSIAYKTATSTFPSVLWINMEYPDVSLTVYPVPDRALEWHIVSADVLTQASSIADTLSIPPGYLRAFRFNLACEIAPEFGKEPSATVQRIALKSLLDLKRINQSDDVMGLPPELVGRSVRYNIYSGDQ